MIRTIPMTPTPVRETTGERIRRLRLSRGWSQARLAEEACLDQQTVSHAELHGADMYASTLDALAGALETTMDALWSGREAV